MTEVNDVTQAIQAKSDQLNADDLIGGPITVKITSVSVIAGEQPISISYDGDNKRPWKPSKTSARCLAAIWGANANQWVGMHCTLYNDPTVTWAGAAVGGVRVSHMEGIDKPRTLQLAKTRGKKQGVTIQPLHITPVEKIDPTPILEEARVEAGKGRELFLAWWAANKDKHETAKPIMDELKQIAAKADAGNEDNSEEPM